MLMMFSCVIYRNYRGDLAFDIMKRRGASQELCEFMSKVYAQKSFSVISKRHNNKDVITELVDSLVEEELLYYLSSVWFCLPVLPFTSWMFHLRLLRLCQLTNLCGKATCEL